MKNINSAVIKRLLFIDKKLNNNKYVKTGNLAEEYGVSVRTIYRDFEFLKNVYDAPVGYDNNKKCFCYLKPFSLNIFDFSVTEYYNLAVIKELIKSINSNPYKPGQKTLFRKLLLNVEKNISMQFDEVKEKISFKFTPAKKINDKVFKKIELALISQKTIVIVYDKISRSIPEKRTINPYHLRNFNGDWYLIGLNKERNKVRVLSVSRIREVRITDRSFDIPYEFSVKEYFKDSFGNRRTSKIYNVKLEVFQTYSYLISEKKIHHSQKSVKLKNGNLIVTLKVNELSEIKEWILKNGPKLKVISPPELAKLVKSEADAVVRLYV